MTDARHIVAPGDRRIETERLLLRPFEPGDKAQLIEEIGAPEVAATTLLIPHPYTDADADFWVDLQARSWAEGSACNFAITLRAEERLVGGIGLSSVDPVHRKAELGFWLGPRHWNQGLMTEAVRGVLAFGFGVLKLNRIYAGHFAHNAASGRVQAKAGMRYEGVLRQDVIKDGTPQDHVMYAILASEYEAGA